MRTMRIVAVLVLSLCPLFSLSQTDNSIAGGQWLTPGPVRTVRPLTNGVDITAAKAAMRVDVLNDSIVRVRIVPSGRFYPDQSFAVVADAVKGLKPSAAPRVRDMAQAVEVFLAGGRIRIEKNNLRTTFFDAQGNILSEDDPNRPLSWNTYTLASATRVLKDHFTDPARAATKQATQFRFWKLMPEDEDYFGLGDKAGPLSRKNLAWTMWNTDAFGWQESTDPIYKSIPFFVALRKGVSYGIFLDNTFRVSYDFGKAAREAYSISSDDGPIDYYFIYGPHPKKVIEQYTAITGRTPMPPLWTLGYQQCRYSYFPEARVREIVSTFKQKQIPLDAIYLDIDYQKENRPFTIDEAKFPNFDGMIQDFLKQGVKAIVITDLHIWKGDYPPYLTGLQGDHFVKNPNGSVYVGTVWPGPSVFPDFTAGARTREWWGNLYREFLDNGIKGFWNDMNEPAVFERKDKTMPLDNVHRVAMPDGSIRKTDHREIHNVFGMENIHATYEGMLSLRPDLRPFVLTRAGYAGSQRYGATWTGDNTSSWNHLRLSLPTVLNLGISGYANVGVDIGGFWGNPMPDVLTRWHQIGAFNPMYRNHSTSGTADQEPWVHGPEHEAIRKKYIELRYRLMPYTYTAFEENVRTGVPVMRAMFLEYPEMGDNGEQFLFGRDILVAPAVWEMLPEVEVELPKGAWYDYWTSDRQEGGKTIKVKSTVQEMPLFVRAGAIVPHMPLVQNFEEKPNGPLELRLYAPANGTTDCSGSLYWDDGLTFAFRRGEQNWLRMNFTCEASPTGIILRTKTQGSFQPWWNQVQVTVVGAKESARSNAGGGRFDAASKSFMVTVPAQQLQQAIEITY